MVLTIVQENFFRIFMYILGSNFKNVINFLSLIKNKEWKPWQPIWQVWWQIGRQNDNKNGNS